MATHEGGLHKSETLKIRVIIHSLRLSSSISKYKVQVKCEKGNKLETIKMKKSDSSDVVFFESTHEFNLKVSKNQKQDLRFSIVEFNDGVPVMNGKAKIDFAEYAEQLIEHKDLRLVSCTDKNGILCVSVTSMKIFSAVPSFAEEKVRDHEVESKSSSSSSSSSSSDSESEKRKSKNEKIDKKIEKVEEKFEKKVEKIEEKIEKKVEKAEEKIEKKLEEIEKLEKKIEKHKSSSSSDSEQEKDQAKVEKLEKEIEKIEEKLEREVEEEIERIITEEEDTKEKISVEISNQKMHKKSSSSSSSSSGEFEKKKQPKKSVSSDEEVQETKVVIEVSLPQTSLSHSTPNSSSKAIELDRKEDKSNTGNSGSQCKCCSVF